MVVVGLFVPYGLILGYNYLYLRLQRMWFNRVCEKISIHSVKSMANKYKAKRPRLYTSSDQSYFDSYGDVAVHEEMLGDIVRTNAYRQAIFNCSPSLQNKVVLDVGAGTGILSCFCAQAGAKKVYAVEASNIAEQAEKVVAANGLGKQVIILQSLMEDVNLPEKVDVIVSEWMGYCLLYESMLSSVITARDRWLKPDGIMLPSSASMYLAPVSDDEMVVEKVNFWNDMYDVYGVDMSSMLPFARKSVSKDVVVKAVTCEHILSRPQLIASFDLRMVNQKDIASVQHSFHFSSFGIAELQGFALWFDVSFSSCKVPRCLKCKDSKVMSDVQATELEVEESKCNAAAPAQNGLAATNNKETGCDCKNVCAGLVQRKLQEEHLMLSTSPYKPETHWKQSLFYINEELPVVQDSVICGNLKIDHCKENRRFLNISLHCKVDDRKDVHQSYYMGYELPEKVENNQ